MSHIHKDKSSKVKRFFTGNGFYLSLAACVVAVGGVALATFVGDFDALFSPDTQKPSQSEPVDKNVTGVPDTSTTATTAQTTTTTTTTTAKPVVNTTAPDDTDFYVLPLSNVVCKEFSDGQPIYSETMKDFRLHDGVDFRGKHGDKVMAVANGTVTAILSDALWGNGVTIDHGYGVSSTYYGVTASVKKGDTVKAGQAIGKLSSVPCESMDGEHLHLEIKAGNEMLNPIEAIGREVNYEE